MTKTTSSQDSGSIRLLPLSRQTLSDILSGARRAVIEIDAMSEADRYRDHPGLTLGLLFRQDRCHLQIAETEEALESGFEKQFGADDDSVTAFWTLDFAQHYAPGYVSFASAADLLRDKVWQAVINRGVLEHAA